MSIRENENKFTRLASELLATIFSSLPRRDLAHVARVCRAFTLPGSSILYQHIDLHSDDPHIQSTLSLLQNNGSIEKRIISAVLTTAAQSQSHGIQQHPQWIDPTIARRWTNLRSLEIRGYPFPDTQRSNIFVNTLQNSCLQLRRFTYRPNFGTLPTTFDLTGLNNVAWHVGNDHSDDVPLTPTMGASKHTITHISFVGSINYRVNGPYSDFITTLQFPSLVSLELGGLAHTEDPARANRDVTQFILAHPTIAHLSLGRTRPLVENDGPADRDPYFQFDGDYLRGDFLPSLKSFEGFLENVAVLASKNVQSIFTITSLSIYCPYNDTLLRQKFCQMHSAVTHANVIPRMQKFHFVTHLRFEFFTRLNHMMETDRTSFVHRLCMDDLSQLCPGVTSWYGRLPPMTSTHLATTFGMQEKLEIISLPRTSMSIHILSTAQEYFEDIAAKCTKLKKVIGRKPEYTEDKHYIYTLHRDSHGNLASVTLLETSDEPSI